MSTDRAVELAIKAAQVARGGEVFVFKMPVVRLDDLISATIDVVAPMHGLDPSAIAREPIEPRAGEKAYEELMTEDESTRARRHRRHVRGAAVDRDRARRARGVRRSAVGARSAPIARTASTPLDAAPAVRQPRSPAGLRVGAARRRSRHEGPRDRRGRLHRPLGRRRAARRAATRSCRSTTSSPATSRRSTSSRDHPGLRPFERGDVRDAAACRRWARGGRRGRPPGRVDLGPGVDRRPGDDIRERCRRHVQRARGGARRSAPGPVHEHVHGLRPGRRRTGIDEDHPTKPASPYAASKLSGEALTLSYHHAYGLPTTVVRPFNTYGPFQRSVGEGGVVAIFTRRSLLGRGAAHLRRRDADARPAVRRGLRAVRGRGADLRRRDRPDPQRRHGPRRVASTSWRR